MSLLSAIHSSNLSAADVLRMESCIYLSCSQVLLKRYFISWSKFSLNEQIQFYNYVIKYKKAYF